MTTSDTVPSAGTFFQPALSGKGRNITAQMQTRILHTQADLLVSDKPGSAPLMVVRWVHRFLPEERRRGAGHSFGSVFFQTISIFPISLRRFWTIFFFQNRCLYIPLPQAAVASDLLHALLICLWSSQAGNTCQKARQTVSYP